MMDIIFLLLFFGILAAFAWPLGWYISRILEGSFTGPLRVLKPLEGFFLRLTGISSDREMRGSQWVLSVLSISLLGIALVFLTLVFQNWLPLNPQNFPGLPWDLALNTAISFVTNTNWQNYGGESTLSYWSQMTALAVQNFLSVATGIAVLTAFVRGFYRKETQDLGNFWVDMTRILLFILLPLALILSLLLGSQGVIQNFDPYREVTTLTGNTQIIPGGPAASQIAIKHLGANGGGFFNTNSSHPFENPTGFTNLLEIFCLLLLPASLVFDFGFMIRDRKQGMALYLLMTGVLILAAWGTVSAEKLPLRSDLATVVQAGEGNMEGKETRFGIVTSSFFAVTTTATSSGAVNSMHDSFTPWGGMVPMVLMQLGEVIFGGVGSGLYGMLAMVILTVFLAGLMVGRTPEYLGKKIEAYDMKMVVLITMVTPLLVLVFLGMAAGDPKSLKSLTNSGPHGFSELLYAYTSAANNNGSAFAGLNGNTVFFNLTLGAAMFLGRFAVIVPVLFLAQNMARKKISPPGIGSLPTHGLTFNLLLLVMLFLVAALNFVPSLALGSLADGLQGWK